MKRHLANKISIAIVAAMVLIMGAEILVRLYFGTQDRIELINITAQELASSTYAGIKHPMAVGDSQAVIRQMADIRETAKDVEVFICNFAQEIIYSTQDDKLRTNLADAINNQTALQALGEILKAGTEPANPFADKVAGRRYFVYFYPILNQADCHHCHGSSRKVLGSIAIRMSVEKAYETVAAQRDRTLLLTVLGILLVITVTYAIVSRFVKRPVEGLAEQATRFAAGDTTVFFDSRSEDEIGVLGRTFNYMVECVTSARKRLEEEVAEKTHLLTERTRLIMLLEKANRELRQMDQLKTTFLANMSHELRTPMNAIIGYTDLLIDGVDGPINEEQERSLKKIATNSRYLLQLINDILDISKIESGKMQLCPSELDLKWLIESAISIFEPMLRQKGLSLSYHIDEKLSLVYGDEDALRHILMNLLSNAVKFTEKGGITITVGPSERAVEPGAAPIFAEVCVADSGIGIREEDLGSIFDKFVQVDLTTVRQHEGTGLGLSIARGLVSLHKGMIWATSVYGQGSKFHFTIPLTREILEGPPKHLTEPRVAEALADYFGTSVETFLATPQYAGKLIRCWHYVHCGQPSCPAYESEESRCWLILGTHCVGLKTGTFPEKVEVCRSCELIRDIVLQGRGPTEVEQGLQPPVEEGERCGLKTVLAIDDNPDGVDIIKKYVGNEYTVIGLLSGEDAVEKARAVDPLAIILDILMPNKDGWQVLRELKETPETQDIPVIVASILDDKRLGFSLGAAEYIVKPVEKELLLKKLKNLERMSRIRRVLVVDNEADTVRLIRATLEEAGYEVITSYNSEDAVRAIKDMKPQLVVLNLTMPPTSGLDVIEFMKTDREVKDLPLIVLTGKEFTQQEINELNGRIHGILNKRLLSEEDLSNMLREAILKAGKEPTTEGAGSGGSNR